MWPAAFYGAREAIAADTQWKLDHKGVGRRRKEKKHMPSCTYEPPTDELEQDFWQNIWAGENLLGVERVARARSLLRMMVGLFVISHTVGVEQLRFAQTFTFKIRHFVSGKRIE